MKRMVRQKVTVEPPTINLIIVSVYTQNTNWPPINTPTYPELCWGCTYVKISKCMGCTLKNGATWEHAHSLHMVTDHAANKSTSLKYAFISYILDDYATARVSWNVGSAANPYGLFWHHFPSYWPGLLKKFPLCVFELGVQEVLSQNLVCYQ